MAPTQQKRELSRGTSGYISSLEYMLAILLTGEGRGYIAPSPGFDNPLTISALGNYTFYILEKITIQIYLTYNHHLFSNQKAKKNGSKQKKKYF